MNIYSHIVMWRSANEANTEFVAGWQCKCITIKCLWSNKGWKMGHTVTFWGQRSETWANRDWKHCKNQGIVITAVLESSRASLRVRENVWKYFQFASMFSWYVKNAHKVQSLRTDRNLKIKNNNKNMWAKQTKNKNLKIWESWLRNKRTTLLKRCRTNSVKKRQKWRSPYNKPYGE